MSIISEEVEQYVESHSSQPPTLLRNLYQDTVLTQQGAWMMCGHVQGRLLKMLTQLVAARTVLEIGTFVGYSTLSFAEALPRGGRIVSLELNPHVVAYAQQYFRRSPHGHKIETLIGPALQSLEQLDESFDLVFIDADKKNYAQYYEKSLEKLNTGGLMVLDNTLWSGDVLAPTSDDGRAIAELNAFITEDKRVECVQLTVRDGITLVRKIRS